MDKVRRICKGEKDITAFPPNRRVCKGCYSKYVHEHEDKEKKNRRQREKRVVRALTNPHKNYPGKKELICKHCQQLKKIEEFRKKKQIKSGYSSTCNECANHRDSERGYAKKHYKKLTSATYHLDTVKKCSLCNKMKLLDAFYKSRGSFGRSQICKQCHNEKYAVYYQKRCENLKLKILIKGYNFYRLP